MRTWVGVSFLGVGVLAAVIGACVGDSPQQAPDGGSPEAGVDAGGNDAVAADAAADAKADADAGSGVRCDPTKPWGAPKEVPGINSGALEGGGRLSPDELTIYFSSDRPPNTTGYMDMWVATRPDTSSPFGSATRPSGITLIKNQIWPSITGDGLTVYYVQDDEVSVDDLMKAVRPSNPGTFNTAVLLPSVGSDAGVTCPYVLPDDSALYFSAKTSGANKYNLFRAAPPGGTPKLLTELVGDPNNTFCATVLPNELQMVFNSNRANGSDYELYASSRAKTTDPWGSPALITQLNTGADEFANWVSPDGCALYFQRNTSVGSLNYDLWYSVKPP